MFNKMGKTGCVVFLLLLLCMPHPAQTEAIPELIEPVGVKIDSEAVIRETLSEISVYEGAVVPGLAELYFPCDGRVEKVYACIGKRVTEGEVLVTLNNESNEKRLESLKKSLLDAETEMDFARRIAEVEEKILMTELKRLQSAEKRDDAAIELKTLSIREHALNTELDMTLRQNSADKLRREIEAIETETVEKTLLAPQDGVIMMMNTLQKGSTVSAYSPIIYLADETGLFVETERVMLSTLRQAVSITALIGAERYAAQPVEMDEKELISKALAGETITSRFTLTDADGVAFGEYAVIMVETRREEDALTVPNGAIFRDSAGSYVYVMEEGQRVRRNVKTGLITDARAQVTEGLEEGEQVYVQD